MDDEAKSARRAERIQQKKAERLAAKAAAEAARDAERGAPPAAVQGWRVEPDMVPDMLAVWELCMVRRQHSGHVPCLLSIVQPLTCVCVYDPFTSRNAADTCTLNQQCV
jgi:hypothetical protein